MARTYSTQDVKKVLLVIGEEIVLRKDTFTEIDGKLGDGDMGISLEKAALAVAQTVRADEASRPGALLKSCAQACNRAAPSTLGTLLSLGMAAIGKAAGDAETLDEAFVVRIPLLLADEIARRGRAKEGDKTILDALYPYARELQSAYEATGSLETACLKAAGAAHAGMEGTKGKPARMGRAKWLAERNMDCPDGGAVLCDLVAERLCRAR